MKILIADDHTLFRQSLKSLLATRGHTVIGEARTGKEAISLAVKLRPDVVLMDLNMPELDGLSATKLLAADHPEIRVVVLTATEDESSLFEAIRVGAQGYLVKTLEADQFFRLLDGLLEGQPALSPSLARRVLQELAKPATKKADDLTERETVILQHMAEGKTSNAELSELLGVSPNTVKFHVHNILEKLHLRNRAEAVSFALRNRLVALPKKDE